MHRLIVCHALVAMALCRPAWAAPEDPPDEASQPVLTRPPELIHFVEAEYPAAAQAEGRTGTVGFQFTIGVDGRVTEVEVVRSAGADLDAAALKAVTLFEFRPAEIDGAPGPVRIGYDYTFTLETKVAEVPATEAEVGRLEGQLLERGTRKPLVGVLVRLPDLSQETLTDAEGRFVFEAVPTGEIKILIEDDVFADLEDLETVSAGQVTEVQYRLDRVGFEDTISVIGRRPDKQVVRRSMSVREIRTIPGTQGDALKVIQNLPGVARQIFSDTLVLRGGGRSQAFLDQHPIPLAFHFGGLRSTVSSGLIESIDVYPGNFGAEYGRLSGGIVDIRLRQPATDGVHGYAEMDVFDSGFLLEGPVSDHWSLAVAGRRSYIDLLLPLVLGDDSDVSFRTAPAYYDGQILAEGRYGRHTLKLLGLLSSDELKAVFKSSDGANQQRNARFSQDWWGGRAQWIYRHDADLENDFSLSWMSQTSRLGLNQGLAEPLFFDTESQRLTLRDTLRARLTDEIELRLGTDTELLTTTFTGRTGLPDREGVPEIQDGPPGQYELRNFDTSDTALSPAFWGETKFELGALTLVPGVRVDVFGATEEVFVQPRLNARYQLTKQTALKGGIGSYVQPPEAQDRVQGLGDPGVKSETSVHYSMGFEHQFSDAVKLDVTGFYKTLNNLVTPSDEADELVRNQGEGRAYGMELLLRHDQTDRLYGWLAYTLSRSERRDQPGGRLRPFDLDQTHNLTLVSQYKITPRWEAGLRWRFVTGDPLTPVRSADYDADTGVYMPVFGAINSDRSDPFHQLDVRTDYHFIYDTWKLTLYLEVQNVYNRQNPEGVEYSYDYRQQAVASGLPIIPSIAARVEF